MKAITHAQKDLMLEYFRVLEILLRRALDEAAKAGADAPPLEPLARQIAAQTAAIAARVPAAEAPTLQQIRKTLEAVLDPAFFGGGPADPIRAVGVLRDQLRHQKVYTPPEGGRWTAAKPRPQGAKRLRRPAGRG